MTLFAAEGLVSFGSYQPFVPSVQGHLGSSGTVPCPLAVGKVSVQQNGFILNEM